MPRWTILLDGIPMTLEGIGARVGAWQPVPFAQPLFADMKSSVAWTVEQWCLARHCTVDVVPARPLQYHGPFAVCRQSANDRWEVACPQHHCFWLTDNELEQWQHCPSCLGWWQLTPDETTRRVVQPLDNCTSQPMQTDVEQPNHEAHTDGR